MAAIASQLSFIPLHEAHSPRVRRVDEIPNYELIGCVGSSRFGDVWLAREQLTDVIRAVKFLDKHDGRLAEVDLEGVRHYQRCAHNHPHLLPILTVGQTDRCFFYVMEAADSEPPDPAGICHPSTLRAFIVRSKRLEAREALLVLRKLAAGVARLHDQGLTHDDLKPENILFVQGEPKIADVGLARPTATRTGGGTPGYLAPDGPDDIYALGKILYELLSGKTLTEYPRLDAKVRARPTPELTAALRILDRACQPTRARRFKDANELIAAIDGAFATSRTRRSRHRWLIATGIALGCAAASLGTWWLMRPPADIYELQDGKIYTWLKLLEKAKFSTKTPQRGETVHVALHFEIRGAENHDLVAVLVLDSRPDSAQLLYSGTPGPTGERRQLTASFEAPSGKGEFDVRIYASHVKMNEKAEEMLEDFRKSLVKHNPGWTSLGSIRVP